jgi:hypothetical protein
VLFGSQRTVVATIGTLLGPLLVASVYLSVSRWPEPWFTSMTDWIALGLAILVGLTGLWSLPFNRWQRATATLIYVPVMGVLLGVSALLFVCELFGDCL